MRLERIVIFIVLVISLGACQNSDNTKQSIGELIDGGEFKKAELLIAETIKTCEDNDRESLEIKLETISRIQKEFPYSAYEVKKQLEKFHPNVTEAQLQQWEQSNQLEMRIVDGEKRYFKRAVSNLFRLNKEAKERKDSINGIAYDGVEDFRLNTVASYFQNDLEHGKPFDLRRIKVIYTIALKPNQVPDGEVVQCWLPYPRTGLARLPNVEFLSASEKDFIIAPNETMQRTVYMEKQVVKDAETVFSISYIFHSAAQWFGLKPSQIQDYDKSSELYQTYTAERLPHIILNDEIRMLANKIVGNEVNPVKQVELLFYWIHNNIPWAGALEYSVMACIPNYVLENRHGDCGMKTFLFLSMARSIGIPCKWQSGWYLLPQKKNLHDWAEVYYEGVGWVPVDPSFGLIASDDNRIQKFYINGMDSYRLVVNDDYAQELFPPKKYYRSAPFDFQRGELEWKGGNLYFDTWSYNMEVEYLED